MTVRLVKNPDILQYVGSHKRPGQVVCGFSMETRDLIENSGKKLRAKHADMIVANSLTEQGAGFGVDTNVATLLTEQGHRAAAYDEQGGLSRRNLWTGFSLYSAAGILFQFNSINGGGLSSLWWTL